VPHDPKPSSRPEASVKKLVLAAAAAAGSVVAWRRINRSKAEQELWAEATDSLTPPAAS
jgi:hypothetical protein